MSAERVTTRHLVEGLREAGLGPASTVLVHSSLRSFGHVDGGAAAVADALVDVCGTVVVPADTWDATGIPAPPGLVRPHNAYWNAGSWREFDDALGAASAYAPELPVDREMGAVPEALRLGHEHLRTSHPLKGFVATGDRAARIVEAQRVDDPLAPVTELAAVGGDVVLLGAGHTASTTIHVAEQQLGRSRFHRYAAMGAGAWAELPSIPGESHRFDDAEVLLRPVTREVRIGLARVRVLGAADVIVRVRELIERAPRALLCDDPGCRCAAAWHGREPGRAPV